MLVSLALSALCASTALAHGPARLDQPNHLALQRRQAASSILSSFETAVSSAAGASATPAASSSSSDVDSASQSYLPLIVSAAQEAGCTSQADALTRAVAGCIATNQQDQVQAVVCACGEATLEIAEEAARCVVEGAASQGNSSALQNYNSFVNQCITLNLSNSTALASISGQSVTAAVPTTTVLTLSSSSSSAVSGASNATSVAEASGSVSSPASSQVNVVAETTSAQSAPSQSVSASATGGGSNGAGQVKAMAGALALAGVVAFFV